ncbi:hypothetical protein NUW58_g2407 [Xylaria curta]|uniref:Uncharacterized protein n=1 Tax=Xylaria curta TaxID=42375 RepID=A0ACC1PHB3_9PEZI|nr:hypothetical protein NUW58_g2407 [Xylaria curta]
MQQFVCYEEFRSHSAGPHGNFFAICWPDSNVRRAKLAAEIIETLWIYDDIAETLPYSSAWQTHANLRDCLIDERNKASWDTIIELFENFKSRITRMDSKGAPAVIEALRSYLDTYDSRDALPTSLQEYIEFRILNVGFGIMEIFMQWTTGICLDKTEATMSRDFYLSSGRVMALTNDLYSWEVERRGVADRSWNAVPILMKQHAMEEQEAVVILKGLIMYHEQHTRRLGLEFFGSALFLHTPPYITYNTMSSIQTIHDQLTNIKHVIVCVDPVDSDNICLSLWALVRVPNDYVHIALSPCVLDLRIPTLVEHFENLIEKVGLRHMLDVLDKNAEELYDCLRDEGLRDYVARDTTFQAGCNRG